MTELFLEVETKDPSLGFRIFDSTHLSTGETEIQIYEGITENIMEQLFDLQ